MNLGPSLILCLLLAPAVFGQPTYSKEVSRIIQEKCQTCHRPNDVAPFALLTYDDAANWAPDIERVVTSRLMPPWKPADDHGKFKGYRGLSDEQRQTLIDWVQAGAPEGDPADLPEPLDLTSQWALGQPDVELQMAESYTPPRGKDMYRCFVLPTGLTQNQFISAIDVQPGRRSVVHHVILYLDSTGDAEKLDAADDGPGYTCFGGPGTGLSAGNGNLSSLNLSSLLEIGANLGGWAPGQRPEKLPDGTAMYLDQNARIVMQVHYYSTRQSGDDQTKVGLYFSQAPVERRLIWMPVVPLDRRGRLSMQIPAGAKGFDVKAEFSIPPISLFDLTAVAVYPHMHLLGTAIKLEVERPRESPEQMIAIDNWDFNWQGPYQYNEPVKVPAGSKVRLTCTYDNSVDNPRNPAVSPRDITWGEGTEDEMCLALVGITFDRENLLPLNQLSAGRLKK